MEYNDGEHDDAQALGLQSSTMRYNTWDLGAWTTVRPVQSPTGRSTDLQSFREACSLHPSTLIFSPTCIWLQVCPDPRKTCFTRQKELSIEAKWRQTFSYAPKCCSLLSFPDTNHSASTSLGSQPSTRSRSWQSNVNPRLLRKFLIFVPQDKPFPVAVSGQLKVSLGYAPLVFASPSQQKNLKPKLLNLLVQG